MTYQIFWLVENRVLMSRFDGDLSKAELEQFIHDVRLEIRRGTPKVYHISDSLKLGHVGLSLKGFQELLSSISMFHELGYQIDINHHPLNKMLAAVAGQFVGVRTRTVTSLEEAIAFLKRIDPALDQLEWTTSASGVGQ